MKVSTALLDLRADAMAATILYFLSNMRSENVCGWESEPHENKPLSPYGMMKFSTMIACRIYIREQQHKSIHKMLLQVLLKERKQESWKLVFPMHAQNSACIYSWFRLRQSTNKKAERTKGKSDAALFACFPRQTLPLTAHLGLSVLAVNPRQSLVNFPAQL